MIRFSPVIRFLSGSLLPAVCCAFAVAQDSSVPSAERSARQNSAPPGAVGSEPLVLPLWPGKPPKSLDGAPPETVEPRGAIQMVSVPTISVYLPPPAKATGIALIVCAGGGYGSLAWKTHVVYAADVFVPKGVAVIGLKYRLRPPYRVSNAGIQEITLLDAKRAMRLVRARAKDWHIDPHKIGIAGYSAGATSQ